jgi:hypothetical protein
VTVLVCLSSWLPGLGAGCALVRCPDAGDRVMGHQDSRAGAGSCGGGRGWRRSAQRRRRPGPGDCGMKTGHGGRCSVVPVYKYPCIFLCW